MADFVSKVTISDARKYKIIIYVLTGIHTLQEEPKMAISVSKWHTVGRVLNA